MRLLDLPDKIILEIFHYGGLKTLQNLPVTCTKLYEISKHRSLWLEHVSDECGVLGIIPSTISDPRQWMVKRLSVKIRVYSAFNICVVDSPRERTKAPHRITAAATTIIKQGLPALVPLHYIQLNPYNLYEYAWAVWLSKIVKLVHGVRLVQTNKPEEIILGAYMILNAKVPPLMKFPPGKPTLKALLWWGFQLRAPPIIKVALFVLEAKRNRFEAGIFLEKNRCLVHTSDGEFRLWVDFAAKRVTQKQRTKKRPTDYRLVRGSVFQHDSWWPGLVLADATRNLQIAPYPSLHQEILREFVDDDLNFIETRKHSILRVTGPIVTSDWFPAWCGVLVGDAAESECTAVFGHQEQFMFTEYNIIRKGIPMKLHRSGMVLPRVDIDLVGQYFRYFDCNEMQFHN